MSYTMGNHPDSAAREEKKGKLINLFRLDPMVFYFCIGMEHNILSPSAQQCQAIGNNTLGFRVGDALLWHLCEG